MLERSRLMPTHSLLSSHHAVRIFVPLPPNPPTICAALATIVWATAVKEVDILRTTLATVNSEGVEIMYRRSPGALARWTYMFTRCPLPASTAPPPRSSIHVVLTVIAECVSLH